MKKGHAWRTRHSKLTSLLFASGPSRARSSGLLVLVISVFANTFSSFLVFRVLLKPAPVEKSSRSRRRRRSIGVARARDAWRALVVHLSSFPLAQKASPRVAFACRGKSHFPPPLAVTSSARNSGRGKSAEGKKKSFRERKKETCEEQKIFLGQKVRISLRIKSKIQILWEEKMSTETLVFICEFVFSAFVQRP